VYDVYGEVNISVGYSDHFMDRHITPLEEAIEEQRDFEIDCCKVINSNAGFMGNCDRSYGRRGTRQQGFRERPRERRFPGPGRGRKRF